VKSPEAQMTPERRAQAVSDLHGHPPGAPAAQPWERTMNDCRIRFGRDEWNVTDVEIRIHELTILEDVS
jgi:hypothetical protein